MNTIEITKESYFSEGQHRTIYVDPRNSNFCIKIPKTGIESRSISREIKYLNRYSKNGASFLSMYHGKVETNLGTGYTFDLIRDDNGTVSQPLSKCRNLTGLEEKVYALYLQCVRKGVIIGDLHSRNVVAQMDKHSNFDLWVVDGVGNSDYLKICDYSAFFRKKKIIRSFIRLNRNLGLALEFN